MPSIIEGYNYDIFISYRQKDNKHDGWVTEFVNNLKGELESTFKEEISVYFDINPHDGLLETDDVDESLKEKLKCLVFVPIISRTYCDPKSFAWEHEFKAFVEQASQDKFGLKIKLPNGNVVSRVLPVRIHDLDFRDNQEFEKVLGGVLRGIEFIYKEPGVNRPLTPKDNEEKNFNRTNYRNQINKVALAIKEIISGLKKEPMDSGIVQEESVSTIERPFVQEKSIIVLPFVNISAEQEQEYFCDGMTEEIINALTHVKDLRVIARTSSFAFKNKDVDIREIGEKLNVGALLEGSVRKSGDRLRITAQLINVEDRSHIWSERYDRSMKDIFDIQDEITLAIVDNLKVKLISSEKEAIVKHYTDNPELYNFYLLGLHHWNRLTPEDFARSEEYFEQAIKKDTNYPLVYVGIAEVNVFNTFIMSIKPKEAVQKAKEYLKIALRLDKNLAEAYAILGRVHVFYDWDWDKADQEFKRSLELNPNSAMILSHYSDFLSISGQHKQAVSLVKRARDLDPLSVYINANVGERLIHAGHFDEAIEDLKKTFAMEPHHYYSYMLIGLAYYGNSKIKESIEAQEKAYELSGRIPIVSFNLACTYYTQGKKQQGDMIFNDLKLRAKEVYIPATLLSTLYRARGELDEAYKWWEKACDDRDFMLLFFLNFPIEYFKIPDQKRFHDQIDKLRKSR